VQDGEDGVTSVKTRKWGNLRNLLSTVRARGQYKQYAVQTWEKFHQKTFEERDREKVESPLI
jgi:hypothetical protein